MDLQKFSGVFREWEFDPDAWKRAQDLESVAGLHRMAARRLNIYLEDKAAADLERDTNIADQTPASTELCAGHGRPQQKPPTTPPNYVQGGLENIHCDLTEYLWSLENLAENLSLAWNRSARFFAASALAKACQLYFWPSREHEAASGTVLTALTAYHAGFSLAYLSALYLASRCSRHAQVLQGKVREQLRQRASWGLHPKGAADGTVCEDDVRAWGGFNFALVGWVANQRHLRTIPLKSKHPPWIWVSGLIANWVSL